MSGSGAPLLLANIRIALAFSNDALEPEFDAVIGANWPSEDCREREPEGE